MTGVRQADVLILGAGPGGYVAAIRLAQLGRKVTVIEPRNLGGVCLNEGCIPSKALIHAAHVWTQMRHADKLGILVENPRLDFSKLQAWKTSVVQKLTGGIGQLFKSHGITVCKGRGKFIDPQTVEVTGTQETQTGKTERWTAGQILIATGSSPVSIPGFDIDHEYIVDSTDALSWTSLPASLAVIGGGVIGVEMASLYGRLGSQVTLIEVAPDILPGMDADIVQQLRRSMKKAGLAVHVGSQATDAGRENGRAVLAINDPGRKEPIRLLADKVLVAVGRRPNSQELDLEAAGIRCNEKGFIQTDAQCRTTAPNVFAIGDVTSPPLLAHKASKEGLIAAAVIAGQPECWDVRALPSVVFSTPEVATVGLSEADANAQGYAVKIGRFPFAASGRALSMDEPDGFVKLVVDAQTDQILGAHLIGPEVSSLIAEIALAMEAGLTAEDIALTVHAHPTLPEALMEAAEVVHQQAIHIFTP